MTSDDVSEQPDADSEDRESREGPNRSPTTSGNGRKQAKGGRHGTTSEIFIALFTLALLFVAYLQYGTQARQADISNNQLELSRRQFEFTTNEAAASSKAAAASLNVSESAAAATANQAVAMKQMAAAADRQATAAARQATAASRQLALALAASLDLDIHVSPYSRENRFEALGVIANRSSYTIRGKISVARDVMEGSEPKNVWARLLPATETVTIVPGVDHRIGPFVLPPATDVGWDALMNRKIVIFWAIRLDFKDATGKARRLERCVFITGPYNPGHPAYDC